MSDKPTPDPAPVPEPDPPPAAVENVEPAREAIGTP